jgi:hypothetical protein
MFRNAKKRYYLNIKYLKVGNLIYAISTKLPLTIENRRAFLCE